MGGSLPAPVSPGQETRKGNFSGIGQDEAARREVVTRPLKESTVRLTLPKTVLAWIGLASCMALAGCGFLDSSAAQSPPQTQSQDWLADNGVSPRAGQDWPWPGPGATAQPGTGCIDLRLKEIITSASNSGGSNPNHYVPSAGMQGTYNNSMFDAATNALVGHVHGGFIHILYKRKSDGDLIDYGHEDITMVGGGTIHAVGTINVSALYYKGAWEAIAAYGTSGRYHGMTGVELFQAVKVPFLYYEEIVLCR